MSTVRLGRSGMYFLFHSDEGQGWVGLAHGDDNGSPEIRCNLVGVRQVLRGIEYECAEAGRRCSIRTNGSMVELLWQAGETFEALVRITVKEFVSALDRLADQRRRAA